MNTFKANPTNIWVKFDSPEASLHHPLCIPYESDGSRHKLGHSRLFVGISFYEIDRTSSLGSREVNEGLRRPLEALEIVEMDGGRVSGEERCRRKLQHCLRSLYIHVESARSTKRCS